MHNMNLVFNEDSKSILDKKQKTIVDTIFNKGSENEFIMACIILKNNKTIKTKDTRDKRNP